MSEQPRVAFVGLGRMGLPMAGNLVAAGYPVTGSDLSEAARSALTEAGGVAEADPLRAVDGADVVVLMLPDSRVVDVLLFDTGVLAALPGGTLVVDMGSSEPEATRRIAELAAKSGVAYVDAPVSGGVSGARAGSLTIVAGGADADVARARPLLEVLGSRVLHVGPAGAGDAVKALNNLLSATHLLVTSEAMLVARRFGLDVGQVLDAINTSSGRSGSTEKKWPDFIVPETYDSGFGLRLMVKDMGIAVALAESTGVPSPLSHDALALWKRAADDLPENADHTEIARWLSGQNSTDE
ncbi:NAD(P)-dependent oxidoreductase [Pseudonocardia sp. RS11V-5]|uniref:NAD(P)-dependent oxidoreductase n=1 Tax=Pseudonocardia terrae TaxID=2905831 RepID=UPI001E39EE4E|nr:NAD(P)-dependent oxidoreductase [Pseudonocardia terrae]MCE3551408.1 NAD(P)-dependent oxidoreductase [Pseudonocardia terrae]